MTVINVTDATLKGDVAGPTFTGKVDGSKFSGSVTYTDSTAPPIDPPPIEPPPTSENTHGLIENFTGKNGQTFKVDGLECCGDVCDKSWSLEKIDDYTLRFEVRQGDVWSAANGSYTDSGCNRSEVSFYQRYNEGVMMNWEGTMTVLPGPVSTGDWFTPLQSHAVTNVSPTYAPFSLAIEPKTDKLQVVLQHPKQTSNNYVYKSPNPIVRGQPMRLKVKVKMGPTGNGYVGVWLDDRQIVDFNGKVGATNSQYWWKYGAYRGTASEAMKLDFKNVHITTG